MYQAPTPLFSVGSKVIRNTLCEGEPGNEATSTQPFSVIYAHALPQWVSGTRVWLYYERARIINPRRACAARVTVVVPCVCVCVCVFPRPSSATRATKRQTRHTGDLSIVFASV